MCKTIDQYADKIKGQFSFFDRLIINGYFRPLLSEQTRIGYLYSMGIPLRDFTGISGPSQTLWSNGAKTLHRNLDTLLYICPPLRTGKRTLPKDSFFLPLWTKDSSVS